MDDRIKFLEKLSKSFNRDDLTQFMRTSSGKFKPEKSDYSHHIANDNSLKDFYGLGRIDFEDGRRLVVLAGKVDKELTSHSGKKKQFEIAQRILGNDFDAGIFVFHDHGGHFRFSLIAIGYKDGKKIPTSFRRYTYFVTPEPDRNRTFIERVGKADFSSIEKITDAFRVEPVTNEFFREYRRIFEEAETTLKVKWSEEKKRLYAQRFFNRMMFIAFLERKGWLNFNGRKDYLKALFADYHVNEENKRTANFHKSRLNTLFFRGLNNPHGDQLSSDPQYKIFQRLIGDVPYLNGGLFEEENDDVDGPVFSDTIVAKILTELIYHFNFTVTESTPLDVEVAVDPEMLGRIFEELVTGRHESGSYYTPKPVVAFMCREALKGYLETAFPDLSKEVLNLFVNENDAAEINNPEAVLNALRVVKVCDPACGSGAYLLGMLHELLEKRESLFVTRRVGTKIIYERKLEIIQNNLYGVDIDDFAVNIARLRLWLSLIVDYEDYPPPPLPNLDFKIEAGDSLTAPDPSGGLQPDMFRYQQVQEFLRLKNEFMGIHSGSEKKKQLDKQIKDLRQKIKEWAHPKGYDKSSNAFDWQVDFAEVFAPELAESTLSGKMAGLVNATRGQMELTEAPKEGGFDIMLANPPYVRVDAQFKNFENEKKRQEQIREWHTFRKQLRDSKIYKTLHEKWDLYIPFLERAYQLLRKNGQMIFIIPDAYNAAKYASKSHEFFLQNMIIERIDFCSEIDLFDAGVNNTILHFEKNVPFASHQPTRVRRWGKRYEFDNNQENLTSLPQGKFGKIAFRPDGNENETLHGFLTLETICYISKGMVVHAEETKYKGAFRLDDLISLRKDNTHSKKFVEGKDIIKWNAKKHKWLEYGTKRAPSHFSRPTFSELHEASEKLLAARMCGESPAVMLDLQRLYSNHTVIVFVPWHILKGVTNNSINKYAKYQVQDPLGTREKHETLSQQFKSKYLLSIMNSSFAKGYLNQLRRSKLDIYPDDWKKLPIAPISLEEQKEFVKLVDKILEEYEKHSYPLPEKSVEKVREWEGQLNEMVLRLYE
jgi:type I restriction-modification system DNA methylase subunit